jgi:Spy/CpxP family protein refolding chaperone
MNMLKIAFWTIGFTVFLTQIAVCEEQERPLRRELGQGRPPMPGMHGHGPSGSSNTLVRGSSGFWLERKVTNPEFMKQVGITDEQATKLREAWKLIEDESTKLEEEIHQLARQQAEHLKKALSEEGSDTSAVMDVVEKIGKIRIEQAKLAMKRVILIRDHLTPEQRKLLGKTIEDDQKKWRAAREDMQKRRELGQKNPPPPPPTPPVEKKQE